MEICLPINHPSSSGKRKPRDMASSEVEFASSRSFGCVLRDRNRRDGWRERNGRATQAAFQKNLNNLVSNHYNTCISIPSDSDNNQNQNQISNTDSWVSNNANNNLGNLRFISSSSHNNREREEASMGNPRNSSFLDKWAARKARQMVSTIEDEAQLLALPNSSSSSPSEASNMGASSLVQVWEKRLNQSKSSASATPGRWSPTASVTSNEYTISADEAGESADEGQESFPDWESDRTAPSDQACSAQAQNSGVAETKRVRVRVVDIIKRLIATSKMQIPLPSHAEDSNHDQCTNSNTGSPTPQASDHLIFSRVRVRGRQAFKDLLMQMERDRRSELHSLADRKAVSMFTHRGRIQSLLRLKLLQRHVADHDHSRRQSVASELNKQQQGSSIMHLRERFKTGTVERTQEEPTTSVEPTTSTVTSSRREVINESITQCNNSANLDRNDGIRTTDTPPQTSAQCKDEGAQSSSCTFQGMCIEAQNIESEKVVEATPSVADSNADIILVEEEAREQQCNCYDELSEQQYAESHSTDTAEEAEASEQYYYEEPNTYDWITSISRPRSYWEDRRRAWYREMLETGSDNDEICQLLERRTVSTFLSSDFRERMNRLMESHMGTQTHLIRSQEDEDEGPGRMEHLIQFLQERMSSPGGGRGEEENDKIEAEGGREEEEEHEEQEQEQEQERGIVGEEQEEEEAKFEEEGSLSSQYHEVGNYFNQASSSMNPASPSTTWSYKDNEIADDNSDIVTSASSPQPCQSQSFRQFSSSANHHSIEMDLIYDLRGSMEQLYQEMAELRKSIKSCIDMQMMLQQSMAREVQTVKEEKESPGQKPKKGNCCICYEKKVDSLLYRCGHMCACLKCANELQWNSGKCPICRAPIVDVVRVYLDA